MLACWGNDTCRTERAQWHFHVRLVNEVNDIVLALPGNFDEALHLVG